MTGARRRRLSGVDHVGRGCRSWRGTGGLAAPASPQGVAGELVQSRKPEVGVDLAGKRAWRGPGLGRVWTPEIVSQKTLPLRVVF